MPVLIFGLIFSFQKKKSLKGIGNVLAGLGFFFLGIHYMKEGFDVFKDFIDLTQFAVTGFLGALLYMCLGILITTILQSSSATLALILIFPLARFVDILAELLHITPTDYTLKLAIFHTIFNVMGVVIMIPFIGKLEKLLIRVFKEKKDKDIDEPKYLNKAVLEFSSSAVSSLFANPSANIQRDPYRHHQKH